MELTVTEASIAVNVLQWIKALPSSRDYRIIFRFAELKKQMAEIADNKGKQAIIILTPIEGTK